MAAGGKAAAATVAAAAAHVGFLKVCGEPLEVRPGSCSATCRGAVQIAYQKLWQLCYTQKMLCCVCITFCYNRVEVRKQIRSCLKQLIYVRLMRPFDS